MALSTESTELLGVRHPIVLAPMGGAAGGALAAAVSRADGLGLLGGAYGDREWLARELSIVAQGTESGGHGARRGRSTLPFVPLVVDLAAPVPVLAAGGIADGRGVATTEALVDPSVSKAVIEGRGQDTERNSGLDIARGASRPTEKYTVRTLGHPCLDRWRGREAELARDSQARQDHRDDVARGAIPPMPVWAGEAVEAVDLITDRPSAADLVAALAAQAEDALARAGRRHPDDRPRAQG
ncbi:nitronate monooxygenase [Streptomyces goshikiensis]|uniref:nitronate monooxygenase n=1 Tax=Streptomyces goshikiensis TaxID=1942 RepID=UPI00367E184D